VINYDLVPHGEFAKRNTNHGDTEHTEDAQSKTGFECPNSL